MPPTGGSSGVFTSTLLFFRGGHHITFILILMMMCPMLFGISLTQQIALILDNHLELFSLTSWRRPYTFLVFVPGWNHEPLLGAFSQVCKMRVRLHITSIFHISQVVRWRMSPIAAFTNKRWGKIHQTSVTEKTKKLVKIAREIS